MKKQYFIFSVITFVLTLSVHAQWNFNGTNIYNTNAGNVGIGTGGLFTPVEKLHINTVSNTASIMAESSYTGTTQKAVGYFRIKNTATGDMFNMVLRKNGAVHEMLQSCYDASAGLWREYAYYNYGTRKYEMRSGILDVEFKNSGNMLINSTGNVGIGDDTPVAKLTVGSGDKFQVESTHGSLTFTDDEATIKFPATQVPNAPMIHMFSSGTANADRMVISHSAGFPKWGIEYHDTSDVFYFRSTSARNFTFELASGHFGVGTEDPAYPIDIVGRMRIKATGILSNSPGIWFAAQDNDFDRAFLGMSEPDSTLGIWSQHLGKWAIEFEVMREPRIGINITPGSPPRSELHLVHTNFGGANDGVRIENEGSNDEYWNLYTSNTTGDFEFFNIGIKRATIDDVSGAYTAVSDSRLKTNINQLEPVLPAVMKLQPKTYQFTHKASNRYYTGFLAQELEQIFPQFVYYGGDDQVTYSVDYASMSVIALKAIQEQQAQIDELKREIEELKSLVNSQ